MVQSKPSKSFLILIVCLLGFHAAFSQQIFTAVIKDSISLETLQGATVMQMGTQNGGSTDANGKIEFKTDLSTGILLKIQYIGYQTKLIHIQMPQAERFQVIFLAPIAGELEEVVASSVRTNSRIEDLPTRIEVIGMEDLHEENGVKPGNIMSLLGDIAGIQMQQVSASSGNTYARIQGLNGRYTQILKDGMPLFGGLSGSFGIMQVPPLDLKQIEIIKGSASTLYGGDAIGGIINLISKEPGKKPEWIVTLNQSSLKESNFNSYYAIRNEKFGFTLFASQTLQKAIDVDKDQLSDLPQLNSFVIHPKFIFYLSPKSTLTLNYSATNESRFGGNMEWINSTGKDSLYHVSHRIQRNQADIKYVYQATKATTFTAKCSGSLYAQHLNTNPYLFLAEQKLLYSEISVLNHQKKADWVAGINLNADQLKNNSSKLPQLDNYQYNTLGSFAQLTYKPILKLTTELGMRVDHHNVFGNFVLPRASVLYKFTENLSSRMNGGYGYKVPNLITYINPETDLNKISGNNSLRAEISKGANADVNYNFKANNKLNLTLNQSLFYTSLQHPIYDSSGNATHVFLINASKPLLSMGTQTYARVRFDEFEFYLGYVYTQVKKQYDPTHPQLQVTPKHNLSGTLFYEPSEEMRIGIESSFIAGQVDQDYQSVKNYVLFAAMVQYKIKRFTFVLNGENLLDFRQNKGSKIWNGTIGNPEFHKLWAPIDGRVINLSLRIDVLDHTD